MSAEISAPTLRALFARTELHLEPAVPASEAALDTPIRWVHSSDLSDPTPFLSEGLVLLTTGTQFLDEDDAAASDYVCRLVARGVVALGFGTEVVRDGIPAPLVQACADAGMPLFEVPYRTPFIAIARANAEAIAAQAYARRSWSLAAQRAISLAALRPDGLGATVAELSRQLGAWVGLFDAVGSLEREHPPGALGPREGDAVGDEARRVLRRGARAASTLHIGDTLYTLQTLGRGGRLRGAIAVAGDLDAEARAVVTSVVAMTGLALEQGRSLARARSRLRAALVQLLAEGQVAAARRIARETWGELPPDPVVVAVAEVGRPRREAVLDALDALAEAHPGDIVFGSVEHGVAVATAVSAVEAQAAVTDLAVMHEMRVGLSAPAPYDRFAAALTQARIALGRAGAGRPARFGDTADRGVLGLVDPDAARAVASARLAPLLDHDAAHGTDLAATLGIWLEHDGSNEQAARALGIHRHTVRARVALAGRLLGRDLAPFGARADLWADLRALD